MRALVVLARLLPLVLSFVRAHRRWLVGGGPVSRTPAFHARRAERIVAAVAALGPAFVKLAQVLAARADLVPEPYLTAFGALHDRVPPVPAAAVRRTVEAAYGRPVEEVFRAFDWTPLAAASLGQVHRAELLGQPVVVKVLRPGVERTVPRDLALAGRWLGVAERRWGATAAGAHLRGVRAAVDEFARRVGEEMDFRHEAANAAEMRERFAGRTGVAMPRVWPDFVRERVLVLEYMPGPRIDRLQERVAAGALDAQALVRRVIALYMRMMLVDGFFHADPHPGNLLVQDDGTLVVLDFGMVVRVEKRLRRTLARTAFAGIRRDAPGIVDGFYALGLFGPGADRATAEALVGALLEIAHTADTSTTDRMQLVADRVMATLYQFPVTLPADLVYFARTTALIEGLGVRYDARFNAVTFAAPVALELRREIMDSLREPGEPDPIPDWPALLDALLGRAADHVEQATTAVAGAVRSAGRGILAALGRLVTDATELAQSALAQGALAQGALAQGALEGSSVARPGTTIVTPIDLPVEGPVAVPPNNAAMTRLLARTAVLFACAAAAPVAASYAQTASASATTAQPATGAHPNMFGTWELNVASSKFGPQGSPTKGTLTLAQAGDKITTTQAMSTSMGEMTNTMQRTVGVTATDTIRAQGQEVPRTSTMRWDGSTLVLDAKLMAQGTEIPIVARYTLSPDGKQLMVDQTLTSPMGALTSHLVYDKKS